MTASRFRHIIRARWWVLVLIAIASVGIASLIGGLRDSTLLDHRATAGVTYLRLLGELDDTAVEERLNAGRVVAEDVNAAALAEGLGPLAAGATHEIAMDVRGNRLVFIGFGTSDEQATERALGMRERFLTKQALDGTAEIDRRIDIVDAQLEDVSQRLKTATEVAPLTEEDIARDARIAELQAEVGALTERYGALTVELITPPAIVDPDLPPRTAAIVSGDREDVRSAMQTAQTELTALEAARDETPAEDPTVALLRSQEEQLRTALGALVAQRIVEEPIGSLDPVLTETAAVMATPTSSTLLLGLLVGLLVGIVGLVLVDRVRQPLWSATDLEPHDRLPEVRRRSSSRTKLGAPWYAAAPSDGRKAGIQQLRSHVEGLDGFGKRLAVGIAAVSGHARDVHELAADLASSLASSGSRVLLVDVDFDHPSDLVEFKASGADLEEVLRAMPAMESVSAESDQSVAGVVAIAATSQSTDSPDLLAQPGFARFLKDSKTGFDVVIVACPASDSATYHVLTQRVDNMILVAAAGETLTTQVDAALHTLDDRRSKSSGVVLLTRPKDRLSRLADRFRDRSDDSLDEAGEESDAASESSTFEGEPVLETVERADTNDIPSPADGRH